MIPPVLEAIEYLQIEILAGRSVPAAIESYLERATDGDFARDLAGRWRLFQSGRPAPNPDSAYTRALWELIVRGSRGEPVAEALNGLAREVAQAADAEISAHLARLPFMALFPVMVFFLPAFMLLLLGPVLREIRGALGAP